MKRMMLAVVCALSVTGCARFSTTQTDVSYDLTGKPLRTITTKAKAWTFWEAQSSLASFKASQTDQSQRAEVGALGQSSSGTNTVAALNAVLAIIEAAK